MFLLRTPTLCKKQWDLLVYVIMIRKNFLNCKLNLSNLSSKDQHESFMKDFDLLKERCPSCNAVGQCRIHGYYNRNIVDFQDGKVICEILSIARALCTCGHSHGILTDPIVPYRQYSLTFILHVLKVWFTHELSLEKIQEIYGVSHNLLKKWKDVFLKHKNLWLGIVRSRQVSFLDFLERLLSMDPFSAFSSGFFRKTLYSFLQTHANPANCRHHPPGFLLSGSPCT